MSAFLCVSFTAQGSQPIAGGSSLGLSWGSSGQGWSTVAPGAQIPGTQAEAEATLGYRPGPVHGIGTESCEIMPVKD